MNPHVDTPTDVGGAPANPIALALQAIDDAPQYLVHIADTLVTASGQLRSGDEAGGLWTFSRAAADLGQFVQLIEQIGEIAGGEPGEASRRFTTDLKASLKTLERALGDQQMQVLAEAIEERLLPTFDRWEAVSDEFRQSLTASGA